MKTYTFSAHAEIVMTERTIKREWVDRVLAHPELVEADRDDPEVTHALGKISEHGGRVLRVVFNGTKVPMKVVTVYFDRSMKGEI
jgi:Domain of unknown function (DUF4258)